MKPETKRLWVYIGAALIAGVIIGVGGYYIGSDSHGGAVNTGGLTSPYITPVSTTSSVIVGGIATSSASTSVAGVPAPVDMSNWKTYTNYELGFSLQYPPDLDVDTSNPAALTLTFPSSYFSTQMADSDIFSVTFSSTCPAEQSYSDKAASLSPQTATINGLQFAEYTQEDIGAGNYDNSTIYQINQNNACYTIDFSSHAPDSGGLYTTDPAQIAALEAAHSSDEANINAVVSDILSTFSFINTPPGENEATYSAQQSSSGAQVSVNSTSPATGNPSSSNGIINLSSVSTTTVSVGDSLTLNGSGFSGSTTIVGISNGSVNGVLWGGLPSSDTSITAAIPSQVCTQYEGNTGIACPSYLILSPGIYTVSVANQNGTTNTAYIRIQ